MHFSLPAYVSRLVQMTTHTQLIVDGTVSSAKSTNEAQQ
jgi:hypothetical protein